MLPKTRTNALIFFLNSCRFRFKEARRMFGGFILNIFAAPIKLAKIAGKVYLTDEDGGSKWWAYATMYIPLFALVVVFSVLQVTYSWSWAVAFFLYLTFCGCTAAVRMQTREMFGIRGHILEDFLASVFLYPSVIVQLEWTLKKLNDSEENLKARECNSTPLV